MVRSLPRLPRGRPFSDFLVIVGLSEWIDDLDELEELFPSYEGIKRRISRFIRIAA